MLSEEEKKAIDILVKKVDIWECKRPKNPIIFNGIIDEIDTENNAIRTVLNLITKLQKHLNFYEKNESYKKRIIELKEEITKLQKENEEKDKQIDLMREVIFRRFTAQLVIEYGIENKEQFIEKFEKLAKEKGE